MQKRKLRHQYRMCAENTSRLNLVLKLKATQKEVFQIIESQTAT